MSGKHQIEVVRVGVDEKSAYQIGVGQVKMNLTDFDDRVSFYQTKPSKLVEQLFEKDQNREARQDAVRTHFSEKLAAGITREQNKKEKTALEQEKPFEKLKTVEYKPVLLTQNSDAVYRKMLVSEGTVDKQKDWRPYFKEFQNLTDTLGYSGELSGIYKKAGIRKKTDLFYIDGMTAQEYVKQLYPKKMLDEDLMKAEIVVAALNGKHQVEVVNVGLGENGIYQIGIEQITTDLAKFDTNDAKRDARQKAIRADFSQKLAAGITKEQNRIEKANFENEKNEKIIEKSTIVEYKPIFRTLKPDEVYLSMRVPEGTMENHENLHLFSKEFQTFVGRLENPNGVSRIYKQAGISEKTDLFYIDGMAARDYVKQLYPEKTLDENLVKAEIMAAVVSGKHQIEMVNVGIDTQGTYQVGVKQIKMDLTAFDKTVRFYQTKPSKLVEEMFKNDTNREARQDAIRADFSQKLAAGINRKINQEENEKAKRVSFEQLNQNTAQNSGKSSSKSRPQKSNTNEVKKLPNL